MELFFPPLKNHTPSVMLSFYYYTGMFFLYLQKVRKEIGKNARVSVTSCYPAQGSQVALSGCLYWVKYRRDTTKRGPFTM